MLQVGGKIELTDKELADARQKAANECGDGADASCVQVKEQEFQRQRLSEKELENQSTAKVIKGRRLTVNIIQNGKKKTIEVPEGQTFNLDTGGIKESFSLKKKASIFNGITIGGTALTVLTYLGYVGAIFLYALNIIIGFYMFKSNGYTYAPYIVAAIAAFIPYSGFIIAFVFFALRTWIQNMPIPK
jgi:hypothetical protein